MPTLLCLNRQTHAEASPLLYGQHIAFGDPHSVQTFLAQIGPRHRPLLHTINVRNLIGISGKRHMNFHMMSALAQCENLVRVEVDSGVTRLPSADMHLRVAQQIYRDCYYWFEALMNKTGDRDAPLEILWLGPSCFLRSWHRNTTQAEEDRQHDEDLRKYKVELKRMLARR